MAYSNEESRAKARQAQYGNISNWMPKTRIGAGRISGRAFPRGKSAAQINEEGRNREARERAMTAERNRATGNFSNLANEQGRAMYLRNNQMEKESFFNAQQAKENEREKIKNGINTFMAFAPQVTSDTYGDILDWAETNEIVPRGVLMSEREFTSLSPIEQQRQLSKLPGMSSTNKRLDRMIEQKRGFEEKERQARIKAENKRVAAMIALEKKKEKMRQAARKEMYSYDKKTVSDFNKIYDGYNNANIPVQELIRRNKAIGRMRGYERDVLERTKPVQQESMPMRKAKKAQKTIPPLESYLKRYKGQRTVEEITRAYNNLKNSMR